MDLRQKIREISGRQLTIRYILGLSIIAFLLVTFEFFTQYLMEQQKHDANVINVAGRQRMLCQQLAKNSLSIQTATTNEQIDLNRREMRAAVDSWTKVHNHLQYGNSKTDLPGQNSPQIQTLFREIDTDYQATLNATNSLLNATAKGLPLKTDLVANLAISVNINGKKFVRNMDKIVDQFSQESSKKRETLSQIKLTLLGTTLLALFLQALFVFRPGLIRIRQTIVDLKKTRFNLAVKNNELSLATATKSQFLATMNHEIRTPVNAVIGASNLLDDTTLTDEQDELVKVIRHSSDGLLYIINDILDLSKIEAGKLEIDEHSFDIRQNIESSIDILSIKAREKNITLTCDIDEKTPELVIGDSNRLRQILINLLTNAVKFTDNGGKIKIAASADSSLRLSIQDSGIGIPLEKQKSIFDSFSQADSSTSRLYGGTGLGLNICKKLAKLMGGTIWVESKVGTGSTFHVEIPVKPAAKNSGRAQKKTSKTFDKDLATRYPLNVLVADDDPLNLKITRAIFKKMGYSIDTVDDGEKTLNAITNNNYDLVLMDMQMPILSGLEVTRKIRGNNSQNKHPKIVALTANATEQDRQTCLDAGMDDYISKPINIEKLVEAIKNNA